MVELAQRLVRIPTENPPGQTAEACRMIADELGPAGFSLEYFEPAEGFVSLIATREFAEPGPTLILNGHVDVVPAGPTADEWENDPWGAEIKDGRMYGRGSLDMKGPVAGLVIAAQAVVEADAPLRGSLVVAAVADEEQGGERGSGALVRAGKLQADGVLIPEPSDGGVVIAHRGICFVELTTGGRSAHASMPERGDNAVEAMIEVLRSCRSLELRHAPHGLLGGPSVAVGTTIAGGEKVNVIPDRCRATLDVRLVPGMTQDDVVADLRDHLRATVDGVAPEINVLVWGDAAETADDAGIVQAAARAFEREFGRAPELRGMPAGTDGRWFTEAGIPTVMGLAPGGIDSIHIVDESIEIDELIRYSRVYADAIVDFLGTPGES